MHTKNWKLIGLLVSMVALALGASACEVEPDEECAPGDAGCVCEDSAGAACDPEEDDDCSCALAEEDPDMEDPDMEDPDMEDPDMEDPDPVSNYRFVLVEDLTASVAGAYPGVDLDAVQLTKADGGVNYATSVDDFNLANNNNGRNEATSVNAALGAPDDNCQADDSKFVALGGAGGYIIVSFGTDGNDVTIANGDSIVVHEIGKGACPASTYDDDPYALSVSVSTELGDFIELATDAEGVAPITVIGLP